MSWIFELCHYPELPAAYSARKKVIHIISNLPPPCALHFASAQQAAAAGKRQTAIIRYCMIHFIRKISIYINMCPQAVQLGDKILIASFDMRHALHLRDIARDESGADQGGDSADIISGDGNTV